MYFNGSGLNLFCFKKSYKFCSNISKTKQVWFLCWKHSYARTKLNSSAFSWLSLDKMLTYKTKQKSTIAMYFQMIRANTHTPLSRKGEWEVSYSCIVHNSASFFDYLTSIWPWRAYEGWFFKIFIATISFVPFFQHFTTLKKQSDKDMG